MLSVDGSEDNYLTFLGQDILVSGNPSTPPLVDPSLRLQSLVLQHTQVQHSTWDACPQPSCRGVHVGKIRHHQLFLAQQALHIPGGFSCIHCSLYGSQF